jgi:CIC family chloride channel protein
MKDLPIYEALLERDLSRDGTHITPNEPMVIDLVIQTDAPLAGREVRMLGLPSGCVLIRCVVHEREFVLTAFTRLEPHMRVTAVIAPEAVDGLTLLRHVCKTES